MSNFTLGRMVTIEKKQPSNKKSKTPPSLSTEEEEEATQEIPSQLLEYKGESESASISRMVTLPKQTQRTFHGFSTNFASALMCIETLTEYIQLYSIICENFLDYIFEKQTLDARTLDTMVYSFVNKRPKRKQTDMRGGLLHSDALILQNLEYGPFDKIHDWLGDRNKYFAKSQGVLIPYICDSAKDTAFINPNFKLDFTGNQGGDVATKTISKILHGVENPRNAKSINERALRVAIVLKEPAKYNFYFGPGNELPASLTVDERRVISGIINPLSNFSIDLHSSFPGKKNWIYDACIGRHIRRQLGEFAPQVVGLPNIWDPSKQGSFTINESIEHNIGNGFQLIKIFDVPFNKKQYAILRFVDKDGTDVYNDSDTGIYYNTLNNRKFEEAGIRVELHIAVEDKTNIAKAVILIWKKDNPTPYYVVVDSGFSVTELSEILLYVDTTLGPLRPTPRYSILKDITDHLIGLLGQKYNKTILIHFFLMWKYSGDDGTIKLAELLKLIYLSGDNLAFAKSIVIPNTNAVGSYLKIKEKEDDNDDAGEDDNETPNRPQFFMAKFIPDNGDAYHTLIEQTRMEIISGLAFSPSTPSKLTGDNIISINKDIGNLLKSGDFFNTPDTMIPKIMRITKINKLESETEFRGETIQRLGEILQAIKNINVVVSFVKNYKLITQILEKMTDQVVKELPLRVPSRRGINFSTAWSQVSKLVGSRSSLNVAIEQVDDELEKQIVKMKTNIDTINDTHLKQILQLNPNMVVFIEQNMMGYRRALFSAKIQTWLGANPKAGEREFAKQLIERVYSGMYGGFNGGGGGNITELIHQIVYNIIQRFGNNIQQFNKPPPGFDGLSPRSDSDSSLSEDSPGKTKKKRKGGRNKKRNTTTIKMRFKR